MLEIRNLHATIDGKEILRGLNLTVKAGERVEVQVILNAGLLAVSAPNATLLEFFEAKTDLQPQRQKVGSGVQAGR